ncbi:endonuclease I [Vibrio phage 1.262.O._10N.286.51.A9]|nr:endonuclease I [Vibrio phage 1.262.O._10N.286.51.A9]
MQEDIVRLDMSRPNRHWMKKASQADSKWEGKLKDTIFKDYEHHPDKIAYTIPHTYEPDFKRGNILIECKGRFRDSAEARKYLHVRDALDDGYELIFVFYNPNTPMPFAKKRKDGTKFTHSQWAEKHGFRWFDEETIRKFLKENK